MQRAMTLRAVVLALAVSAAGWAFGVPVHAAPTARAHATALRKTGGPAGIRLLRSDRRLN
jgi:hypothetical protein